MNREEIIKLIYETRKEIDKQSLTTNDNVYFMTKEKAEWFLALAHKHAVPKKPKKVIAIVDDYKATHYQCPSCNSDIVDTQNYCDYCGQLLNWWDNDYE